MNLPQNKQIDRVLKRLRDEWGIDPAKCRIDITSQGISVSPPSESAGDKFSEWEKQDNERRSRNPKAA